VIHKAIGNTNLGTIWAEYGELDGAANRLYYAVYQAGWAFLSHKGISVPVHSGSSYFSHEEMEDRLEEEGFGNAVGLEDGWQADWHALRGLRVKADYHRDSVGHGELDETLITFVSNLVGRVRACV
jgi:uncharacterized protein (UPF0332 family)